MLRRQSTKITLVQDDIVAYDQQKAAKEQQKRKQEILNAAGATSLGPFGDPLTGRDVFGRKDSRSREQRLGLGS